MKRYTVNYAAIIALKILMLLFIFGIAWTISAQESHTELKDERFTLVINRPEYSAYSQWIHLIYSEVFKRMNIAYEISNMPLKRAAIEINAGRIDAEPARIIGYDTEYTNLVRVDEPVITMVIAAFARKPNNMVWLDGWDALKEVKGIVDFPLGMKICEDNIPRYLNENQLYRVKNTLLGLKKLESSRTALLIDDLNSIKSELHSNSFTVDFIQVGILDEVPLYMYLNKKHQHLVSEFSNTIKMMKDEGLIDAYYYQVFDN